MLKMKKLLIETYGCQMNVADSEVVASVMGMAGYEVTESQDEADAVFLNTCSVRDNAEQKIQFAAEDWSPHYCRCLGLHGGTCQGTAHRGASC